MKEITRKILGVILIVLGLTALVTPCSPGSWLALIGLELLGFGVLLEKKLLPLLKAPHRRRVRNLMQKARLFLGLRRYRRDEPPATNPESDSQTGGTNVTS